MTFPFYRFAIAILLFTSSAFATDILVYDANLNPLVPLKGKGFQVLKNGKKTKFGRLHVPSDAKDADRIVRQILDFYQNHFNRNSYDNKGSDLEVIVNIGSIDLFGMRQNAAWAGDKYKLLLFGKGGKELNNFSEALDVVAHEFTHAVIESSSNLNYVGESGALNESFADIFGEMIQITLQGTAPGKEFLIGETVITEQLKQKYKSATGKDLIALRDMQYPERSFDPQPSHMNDIPAEYRNCQPTTKNDNCGVHLLSGIPNKVGAEILSQLGIPRAKNLFYVVMTQRLQKQSQFVDFARELRRECDLTLNRRDCDIVDQTLRNVGL